MKVSQSFSHLFATFGGITLAISIGIAIFLLGGSNISFNSVLVQAHSTRNNACEAHDKLRQQANSKDGITMDEITDCEPSSTSQTGINFSFLNTSTPNIQNSTINNEIQNQAYFTKRFEILNGIVEQTNYLISVLSSYQSSLESMQNQDSKNLQKTNSKLIKFKESLSAFDKEITKIENQKGEKSQIDQQQKIEAIEKNVWNTSKILLIEFNNLQTKVLSIQQEQADRAVTSIEKFIHKLDPNADPHVEAKLQLLKVQLDSSLLNIKTVLQYPEIYSNDIIETIIVDLNLASYKSKTKNPKK